MQDAGTQAAAFPLLEHGDLYAAGLRAALENAMLRAWRAKQRLVFRSTGTSLTIPDDGQDAGTVSGSAATVRNKRDG